MSGHTPGPWTVGMGAYKAPRSRIDIRGGDTLPGAVAPPIVASIPRAHDRATCHANARLIAAAPDLLAALREAQRSLAAVAGLLATYPRPSNDPHGRTLLDSMEHAKAASQAARAVLAKAGGA